MSARRGHRARRAALFAVLGASLLGVGCETVPRKDYSAFVELMPRSILVLPPLNESLDADAPYSYLTTISEPLGERGYYVFPVALVDAFMRDNGLPEPADMHAVPLGRLVEVFDPDAVLYLTLEDFGQKFELLRSNTRVSVRGTLVDADSGTELWSGELEHVESGGSDGNDVLALVIGAAIDQMVGTVSDKSHDTAAVASHRLIHDADEGFPIGPLHPGFGSDLPDG